MKTLKNINTFVIGLPILFGLLSFIENDFLFWCLLSTILTGKFQIIAGVYLILRNPKNHYLQLYFVGVLYFFGLWFYKAIHNSEIIFDVINEIMYEKITTPYFIAIPPILAVYLSVIIYNQKETK
ncbi:MAG: hypothetical protein V4666_02155 [Bacteroidota bacterium]